SFAPAADFLRNCRLAPLEPGGFGARIVVPVPPAIAAGLFTEDGEDVPADEPYERRVTLYLMAGLQAIQSALARGKPEDILRGVRQGVSANLCDALASMVPSNPQAGLEVSMSWSRARPRLPQRIRDRVVFTQGQFAIVREAGRHLRE